jgi:DNA-directed RNA polymerase subunit K/omega
VSAAILLRPESRVPAPSGTGATMEDTLPQQLVRLVGGSFEKTALLQKRVRELVRGQKPLYETRERNFIKIAKTEMERGLIELAEERESPAVPPPAD